MLISAAGEKFKKKTIKYEYNTKENIIVLEKNIKFRKITKKFLWNYLFSKWPGSRSGMKFQNPGSGFPDFRRVGIETGIGIAKGREFPLDPGRDPDPVLPYWQGSHRAIRILVFYFVRKNKFSVLPKCSSTPLPFSLCARPKEASERISQCFLLPLFSIDKAAIEQ